MAVFELVASAGAPAPPGPWQVRQPPAEARSFGLGSAATPVDAPLWRVDLPVDLAAARAAFAVAETDLSLQEAVIAAAPARIGALAASGGAVSFSTRGMPAPERQLLALVSELRGEAGAFSAGQAGGPASAGAFSAGQADRPTWAEAEARFRAFVAQVQDAVTNYAVVETLVEGRLICRSSVSWTGDIRSLLQVRLTARHEQLHRRSLALALRSRAALLTTFGAVMRGGAIVAMMASSPAGAVTALPAAWKFVDQLLDDLRARGARTA